MTTRVDSSVPGRVTVRTPWGAVAFGAVLLGACSSAPAPAPAVASIPAPAVEPAPPSPREVATGHFHLGKGYALAGEADCAREEFRKAFEAFEPASRGADPDDAQFAGQLWDSVAVYQALVDPDAGERPPVEDAARHA